MTQQDLEYFSVEQTYTKISDILRRFVLSNLLKSPRRHGSNEEGKIRFGLDTSTC